jgi:hypothetical protein
MLSQAMFESVNFPGRIRKVSKQHQQSVSFVRLSSSGALIINTRETDAQLYFQMKMSDCSLIMRQKNTIYLARHILRVFLLNAT